MKELEIGTLLRPYDLTREHLTFLKHAGLETSQFARVSDDFMSGEAGRKKTAEQFGLLKEYGLGCASLFLCMPPDTTGDGYAPEAVRTARMLFACRQFLWAKAQGIPYMTAHVGALSKVPQGEAYERMVRDFRQLCRFAEDNGQFFLFETGPEPVSWLKRFFADVDSPNLGINFDPANFLCYNTDTPANLVAELGDRVKVVHCKDAVPPQAGETNGHETVLGKGATDFAALLGTLLDQRYRGPLIIERELPSGPEQRADVAAAITFLQELRATRTARN